MAELPIPPSFDPAAHEAQAWAMDDQAALGAIMEPGTPVEPGPEAPLDGQQEAEQHSVLPAPAAEQGVDPLHAEQTHAADAEEPTHVKPKVLTDNEVDDAFAAITAPEAMAQEVDPVTIGEVGNADQSEMTTGDDKEPAIEGELLLSEKDLRNDSDTLPGPSSELVEALAGDDQEQINRSIGSHLKGVLGNFKTMSAKVLHGASKALGSIMDALENNEDIRELPGLEGLKDEETRLRTLQTLREYRDGAAVLAFALGYRPAEAAQGAEQVDATAGR